MMDSGRPIITVAGTAGVGKKSIVARIIGHAEDVALSFPCPWIIDTKYYTADVQIEVIAFTKGECCSAHVGDSEALLLVFDVTDKDSLHSLQTWVQGLDGNVPEVCLMLANRVDVLTDVSDPQHSWHGLAQDWCCHNLFEYIEVSALDPDLDASLSRDGDCQGVRRIISALQAHTWPGLLMKPCSGSLSNGLSTRHSAWDTAAASLPSSRAEQHSLEAAAAADMPAVRSSAAAAAAVGPEPRANGVPAGASPDSTEQHGINGVSMNGHDSGQQHASASNRLSDFAGSDTASEGSDSREDAKLDGFERMMRQLQQERGQLQGLPDVERRARAASMAAQMMQAFGIDDEDSEDASSPT